MAGIPRKMFDSAVAFVLRRMSNKGSRAFSDEKLPRYKMVTNKEERIVHLLSFFDVFFKGKYILFLN